VTGRLAGTLGSAVAILSSAVTLGLIANAVSHAGVPLVAESPPSGCAVEPLKARLLSMNGDIRFIDARSTGDFVAGHIAGAVNVPYEGRAGELDRLQRELPRTQTLVVYCGGGGCDSARATSVWLMSNGWRDVSVLRGGYPVWKAAGFPTASGEGP